jgi:acyl-lipid omega-6 desaturase (Delta-12 desaturase)
VFAFMVIGWPLIILKSGLAGWFKFWFMPWMVYHFWVMFLISHHHHMLKSTAFVLIY